MTSRTHLVFSVVLSTVVVAAVIWGVNLVGSPGTARLQRLDQQRLKDLQTIVGEVELLCRHSDKDKLKTPLPKTIDELAEKARDKKIHLNDPETGERYGYTVKDGTTYELCARFSLERNSDVEVFWNHPSGRHCFTVDVLSSP